VESRKEFISRMMWMLQEVDKSNFKTLDALSMIEYELKHRDSKLIKDFKDSIINFIDVYHVNTHNKGLIRKLSRDVEIRFNELIKNKN
tara:strand:+ start:1058 stop:1321 length:264 start_codon:yes stop_codon:yes gene_type:complete